VPELILCCQTTSGVVEKRFKRDAERVDVRRRFSGRSVLTNRLQLWSMGLTEVPCELFRIRMKNLKELHLDHNNLRLLPSEIAHLTTLERLYVRLSKRFDRDLTKSHFVSGSFQPTHVSSSRARSADQSEGALRTALEADGFVI
jgi:Leucine-rich repeat (LRR) protein